MFPALPESVVANAILNRILMQQPSVLGEFGPEAVLNAANEVASDVGEVEEIGTSDVSCWVKQAFERLSSGKGE